MTNRKKSHAARKVAELLESFGDDSSILIARVPIDALDDINTNFVSSLYPQPERTALLITAAIVERQATIGLLKHRLGANSVQLAKMAGRYVNVARIPGPAGTQWRIIIAQPIEKGPHATQSLLQTLCNDDEVNPSLVILVGMCGGFPENGATGKSVVVARQVFNYEPIDLREGELRLSPTSYRCAPSLIDLVNALIGNKRFGDILVHVKDYASGEKLIDDLNSHTRSALLKLSGDILAFEMEGHGLLHALWEMNVGRELPALVIKGVSDFGDGLMRTDKRNRQYEATGRAVEVTLCVLKEFLS